MRILCNAAAANDSNRGFHKNLLLQSFFQKMKLCYL